MSEEIPGIRRLLISGSQWIFIDILPFLVSCRMVGWLLGWLMGRSGGRSVGLRVCRLVGCLLAFLVGWLGGQLALLLFLETH